MSHPYASLAYAQAFLPDYSPIYLSQLSAHVLKRAIPQTAYEDAMGVYPRTPLPCDADFLPAFEALREQGMISLVLVTDSIVRPPESSLRAAFDHVVAYKDHYLHDFSKQRDYSRHHHYEVRRAHKLCNTRILDLHEHMEAWCALYDRLIVKHSITGIQAFNRDYFSAIASMKPLMVGAFVDDALVSAHIWFIHEGIAYSHLAASSEMGYRTGAAYAVYDRSFDYFETQGMTHADLGGGAGSDSASSGLVRLKQGFSNDIVLCYVCGKILNNDIYRRLGGNANYFPAYRG